MRLLLSEDDPLTAELVERLLKPYSSAIVTTTKLDRTLALIESDQFDLIILDLRLEDAPVPVTLEAIKQIRESQPAAGIIVMSGDFNVEENRKIALRNGADVYLSKQELQPITKAIYSAVASVVFSKPSTGRTESYISNVQMLQNIVAAT